jgi:hypothetical protein
MAPAQAAPSYPSDTAKPDVVAGLSGFGDLWQSSAVDDLHRTVKNAALLQWNDRVGRWINQHATAKQKFRARRNSAYLAATAPATTSRSRSRTASARSSARRPAEGDLRAALSS